jgi:quercetin dioxygenase-like cupin family protein
MGCDDDHGKVVSHTRPASGQEYPHSVRIKYKAGEKSVMHSHPESIAVFLTDAHAKFTYPDGKNEDIKAKAGSVQHMDAFTHLPENKSKKSFEVIQVELKR